MDKPLIAPENVPMWIASTFILALLSLVVGFYALHQNSIVVIGTQTEVLALNKKIEDVRKEKHAEVAQAPMVIEGKK